MADEKLQFDEFKLQRVADGKLPPQGDGVLIFDEVKVVCRLMWNYAVKKLSDLPCHLMILRPYRTSTSSLIVKLRPSKHT